MKTKIFIYKNSGKHRALKKAIKASQCLECLLLLLGYIANSIKT